MADEDDSDDAASGGAGASEGHASGGAALLPSREGVAFAVGTSGTVKLNTLRQVIRPAACWRIDDDRFRFDSSFILPDASREFALLAGVRSPTASGEDAFLLSVFGHADSSGDDDYNKRLSSRRATAVYGLLVRDTALWEELYSNPAGGDEWSIAQIQIMLRHLGKTGATTSGKLDPPTTAAVKEFQNEVKLQPSGFPGSDTRKALFSRYMDALCSGDDGPFRYKPSDFLSRGSSADGKGDRQGCSEFNPVLVFSKDDARAFEGKENKAARDAANLSNRRVVVYLFAPDRAPDLKQWPCPTVKEGSKACKSQFYEDEKTRRSPSDKEREHLKRGRTMACKFYDRMARNSPCEGVRQNVRIFLLGADGQPARNAPYVLSTGSQERSGVTDAKGQLFEPDVLAGLTCKIEWGVSDDDGSGAILPNFAELFLNAGEADADPERAARQLSNLGFQLGDDALNRQAFRFEYGNNDDSDPAIDTAHETGKPKQQRFSPT